MNCYQAIWKTALFLCVVTVFGACGKKHGQQSQFNLEGDSSNVFNWKEVYDSQKSVSPFDSSYFIGTDNVVGAMAYNVSRYRLMSLNYMYKKTRDESYLNLAKLDVDRMFDPQYFSDCHSNDCNGFDDGLKSWSFKVPNAMHNHPIPRLQWKHFKISARDTTQNGNCTTQFQIEIEGDPKPLQYQEKSFGGTNCESGGTLALYSSWSKTGFRNLEIKPYSNGIELPPIYRLNDRIATFSQDWVRVMNEDASFLNDTGEWELNGSGEIYSDATRNGGEGFYYPYADGDLDNHGITSNLKATGKVSVLILKPEALFPGLTHEEAKERLRNYSVEGEILLDRHNWGWAENAIGIRTYASTEQDLYRGRRVHEPLPNHTSPEHPTQRNRWGGIELSSRNTHFELKSQTFKTSFTTAGALSYRESNFLGGPGQSRSNMESPVLESEYLPYEGGASQGSLEWARLVYEKLLVPSNSPLNPVQLSLLESADRAVVEFQTNILPKFYLGSERFDPAYVLGGVTSKQYDGETRLLYADLNRGPLLSLQLLKIARQFPDHWRQLTISHPWHGNDIKKMPTPEQLIEYFETIVRSSITRFTAATWIDQNTGAAQWFGQQGDFWSEFSTWGSDLQHNSLTFYLLTEAMDLGFITADKLVPFAKTFTKIIWNQRTGGWDGTTARLLLPGGFSMDQTPIGNLSLIDLSVDVHGHGSASVGTMLNSAQLSDYWILLARSDFKVYEIMNRWLQGAWNIYGSWWGITSSFFRIQPALLYYMVKYGTPKNIQGRLLRNDDTVEQPKVKISWNHPSDWPEGTTLRYYNVYRKLRSGNSAVTPADLVKVQVYTTQTTYIDDTVERGATYDYWIKSEDSSESNNESDATPTVRVSVP